MAGVIQSKLKLSKLTKRYHNYCKIKSALDKLIAKSVHARGYFSSRVKSVQNGVVDFNYFLLGTIMSFNYVINKIINIVSPVISCSIFSIMHATFT